jgi:16S rRNA (cytosine1402-N4)-methyltransferase
VSGVVTHTGDADHIPVLLDEVIEALSPINGGLYVDGTFGAGGYSRAILAAANCRVVAIDRDPSAVATGRAMEAEFGDRFQMIQGRFGDLDQLITTAPTGIVLDIGVSSMQLDQPSRGFSFQVDGPLDMRMEGAGDLEATALQPSAAELVNTASEETLADIIYNYGEERASRRIARALVAARAIAPIDRTLRLAEIVARAVPRREPGRHPATRTFQALRIHVNDELGELVRGLSAAERLLDEGGRLAVVTFHSLEDRVVKRFFLGDASDAVPSRHIPVVAGASTQLSFTPIFKGHRNAGEAEIARNPRARSAKLRAGFRTAAPARTLSARALGFPNIAEGAL